MQNNLIEINGILVTEKIIDRLSRFLLGNRQGLVIGEPGIGKTYILKSVLPVIYQEQFGSQCRLIKTDFYVLKLIRDGFVDIEFQNNTLTKRCSLFVQQVQDSIRRGEAFIVLIDEIDKISQLDQAQFLSLMEISGENSINLPELGVTTLMPENSKVIAIANFPVNSAGELLKPLKNRLKIIPWEVPNPMELASILYQRYKHIKPRSYKFFGKRIQQKSISLEIIQVICDLAYKLYKQHDSRYDYRHCIGLIDCYINDYPIDEFEQELGLYNGIERIDSYHHFKTILKSKLYATDLSKQTISSRT